MSTIAPPVHRLLRLRRKHQEQRGAWHFFSDFSRVFPYLKPYWKLGVAALATMVGGAAVGLVTPWPLAILVDSVLGHKALPHLLGFFGGIGRYELLIGVVVGGLLLTVVQNALAVFDNYVNTKLEQRMALDFRSDLFRHAQSLSLAFHDQRRTGMLMFQITGQADSVGGITVSILPLVQSVLTLGGMFFIAFKIDSQLALVSLSIVPFAYWTAGYYAKRVEPRLYHVRNLEGETMSIIHEAMQMLRVVTAFGREGHEYRRFRTQGETAVDARIKLTLRQTLYSLGVNTLTATGTALVLGIGAWHVIQHRLSVGELLVVMGYIAAIYGPLEQISTALTSLQQEFVNFRGALDLLDTEADVREAPHAIPLRRVQGRVAFENVSFSYTGREQTLGDISFEVEPGESVAIVGPTGAGKTTLISLLLRFYDADSGRIRIDGHDVRQLRLSSLRDQISVVLQEPLLFSGSVCDNIRYGKLDATDEELVAAAEAANAHDFISRLPDGYDTTVGERGAQLSGGERQRICVARAFLKDAPILVLDEPTSAIDSKTEAVILEALERLMQGRTTFMIAHRLSTIHNADKILVLEHGRVIDVGSHGELIERGGVYRHMYEVQIGQRKRRQAAALALVGDEAESHGDGSATAIEATEESLATAAWALLGAVSTMMREGRSDALARLAAQRDDADRATRLAGTLAGALVEDSGGLYNAWKELELITEPDEWPKVYRELLDRPFLNSLGRYPADADTKVLIEALGPAREAR
jgi:ATP-binding cassette, subfamily B, bacterial